MGLIKAIVLLFLIVFSFSNAEKCRDDVPFYNDRERGWYFFEECEEKEEQEKKEKEKESIKKEDYKLLKDRKVKIPWDKIDKLTHEEMVKLEEESRYISTINPTEENVKEYLKLKVFFRKLALKRAKIADKLMKTDPELIAMAPVPTKSSWQKGVENKVKNENIEKILNKYRDKAIIVMIAKKDCPYCSEEKKILKRFRMYRGWKTKVVYVEEKPKVAKNLKVTKVPDIFLLLNKDGKAIWQRISVGLTTLSELEDSIAYGLKLLGEIKDEEIN